MKSDIVPLKYMDKYWKKSFEDYGKSLVKKIIWHNCCCSYAGESVQIEPSIYNRDRVFKKSKNHFVVFEFQHSRLTRDDLARFALYTYSLSRKYDAYVSLYVVCGPEIRNPISSYDWMKIIRLM